MNYYKILQAKRCGNVEGLTAYERQFVEYLKKIDIKTITGTLPLTFTAKSGNADDWSISGNDNAGKNILDISSFVDVEQNNVVMTLNDDDATISVYTTDTPTEQTQGRIIFTCQKTGNYLFSGVPTNAPNAFLHNYMWDYSTSARAKKWDKQTNVDNCDKNNPICEVYLKEGVRYGFMTRVQASYGTQTTPVIVSPMVRLDGTSSDFEPYQKGVGERTENILNVYATNSENGYVLSAFLKTDNTTSDNNSFMISEYFPISPNTTYALSSIVNYGMYTAICFYDTNKVFISGKKLYVGGIETANVTTPINAAFYRTSVQISQQVSETAMIVKGSTAPDHYIPYGYQIPVTVSQQGQTDKTVDIFIGDSPLTEGKTVSKQSTGVDLELFEGENTVSTTLYNKPDMTITYK
jgi:hypothetical protein